MFCSTRGCCRWPRNGKWSPAVDAADQAFATQFDAIAASLGTFDPRSEGNIRTLLPETQKAARAFLGRAKASFADFTVRILSGTRTYAEQDQLYRKGRFGNPGKIVTNAKGGQDQVQGHAALRTGAPLTLGQVRARFEAGKSY